jgi:predicted cobalt transporter CbtA
MVYERGEGLVFLRRTAHVLSVVTLLAFPTLANGQASQQPRQEQTTGKGAAANQQNTAPPQSVVATIEQPPANDAWDDFFNAMDAISNFVIAALTAALIFVGVSQWKTSNTQSGILNATLDANKIIERAYVTLSHAPPGSTSVSP